jgi:reactive intermediate/imine deaminase
MRNESINPSEIHAPKGPYSQGVSVDNRARTLYISGQIGMAADGTIVEGFEAQTDQCWQNLVAVLSAAGMSVHDLVKVTTFVTDIQSVPALGAIRQRFLDGARPASTLVVSPALVSPDLLIEIEAVACKGE